MGKSRGAWGSRREVCCRGKRRNSYGLILPPPIRRGIIAKLGATDLELLGYRFSNALIRFSRSSIRSRIVLLPRRFSYLDRSGSFWFVAQVAQRAA